MTEHAHADVCRLFDKVLDVLSAQRESVLDRECGGDERLKQCILAMIAAAEDKQFLGDATVAAGSASNAVDATAAAPSREWPGESAGMTFAAQPITARSAEEKWKM